ncbi:MAG: hypothetical protein ACRC9N_11140, partial [Aeromonas sp.]
VLAFMAGTAKTRSTCQRSKDKGARRAQQKDAAPVLAFMAGTAKTRSARHRSKQKTKRLKMQNLSNIETPVICCYMNEAFPQSKTFAKMVLASDYINEIDLVNELQNCDDFDVLDELTALLIKKSDRQIIGSLNKEVASKLIAQISDYTITKCEPSDVIRNIAVMMERFNKAEYGFLLSNYDAKYHSMD